MRLRRLELIVLGALFSVGAVCAHAGPKNLADYPLQVHIYNTHWSEGGEGPFGNYYYGNFYGYHGYGRANLTDGADTHAMEYTFQCDSHFLKSDAGEAFAAKWKKPGKEIEMLMKDIGSDKVRTCELKVTLKDSVYWRTNGELLSLTPAEYKARVNDRVASQAALAPEDTDPSHYPMQLSILDLDWNGKTAGMHHGSGHGNLATAEGISAVDLGLACPVTIHATPEGRYYKAKWLKDGTEMSILLHKTGDPTVAVTCDVKTAVHSDVYVLESAGVLKAVSRDKYKAIQSAEASQPISQ